ncbi:MAG: Hsp20/alpha crystallin family protein [Saprospiraceae bacterium]
MKTQQSMMDSRLGFGKLLEQFLDPSVGQFFGRDTSNNLPNANIVEADTSFVIQLAAPGLNREDFNLSVDMNILKVSADKTATDDSNIGRYIQHGFNYSQFSRSFNLPESIDTAQIQANYRDGILSIEIPKQQKSKELKTIPVL